MSGLRPLPFDAMCCMDLDAGKVAGADDSIKAVFIDESPSSMDEDRFFGNSRLARFFVVVSVSVLPTSSVSTELTTTVVLGPELGSGAKCRANAGCGMNATPASEPKTMDEEAATGEAGTGCTGGNRFAPDRGLASVL